MYDYSKPTIRVFDPEVIVLHVGTNELNSPKKSSEIAKSIIDLAASLKTCTTRIVISLIIPRGDDLNNKASEVNDRLKNMCLNRNYLYIDHSDSINVADHVNDGNLHLNKYGKAVLAKDFTNFLGNMDWWDNDSGSNLSYCEINHNYHLNQYEGFLNPNQIYLDDLSDSKLNEGNDVSVLSGNQSLNLSDQSLSCNNDLKQIRLKNPNNLIIAQSNINSLRNKFDFLVQLMFDNVDILLVSETKIDASFPNAQFHIAGYTIYRRDRNGNGGGLLL